jgi:hypothetical protein
MFIEIDGFIINSHYIKRTSDIFKMPLASTRAFNIYIVDSEPVTIKGTEEEILIKHKKLQKILITRKVK